MHISVNWLANCFTLMRMTCSTIHHHQRAHVALSRCAIKNGLALSRHNTTYDICVICSHDIYTHALFFLFANNSHNACVKFPTINACVMRSRFSACLGSLSGDIFHGVVVARRFQLEASAPPQRSRTFAQKQHANTYTSLLLDDDGAAMFTPLINANVRTAYSTLYAPHLPLSMHRLSSHSVRLFSSCRLCVGVYFYVFYCNTTRTRPHATLLHAREPRASTYVHTKHTQTHALRTRAVNILMCLMVAYKHALIISAPTVCFGDN